MNKTKTIILAFFFLPILLMYDIVKSTRSKLRKTGYILIVLLFFVGQWFAFYRGVHAIGTSILFTAGITDTLTEVHVSGTSMLPTIEDGDVVELHSPKKFGLGRGDKVSFVNEETNGMYYLKRIIGLPGERVSIQNGSVIVNDQALSESYVLNDLPTYGNSFLIDCDVQTVPKDHYFVMGDNRTVSSDSRVIGFVAADEIDGVIKAETEPTFNSAKSTSALMQASFDPLVFLEKLNAKRADMGEFPLISHQQLQSIAGVRAAQIAGNIDDWKQSLTPVEDLLEEKGYRYNLAYEFVTFGYVSEDAALEQLFDSQALSDQFLSREVTEIGVGVGTLTNGSCTVPVIVAIATWPPEPTYDVSVVEQWGVNVAALDQLLATMQSWVGQPSINQVVVRSIITEASEAHIIATRIHTKLLNKQWLEASDYDDIQRYDAKINSVNKTIDLQFGSVQGASTIETGRLL